MNVEIRALSVQSCSDDQLRRVEDELVQKQYTPWMVEKALRREYDEIRRTHINRIVGLGLVRLTRVILERMGDCIIENESKNSYWSDTAFIAVLSGNVEMFEYMLTRGERPRWHAYAISLQYGRLEMLDALQKAGIVYEAEHVQKWLSNHKLSAASVLWLKANGYEVPVYVPHKQ